MMQVERVPEPDGRVSLWSVDAGENGAARRLLGYEQPIRPPGTQTDDRSEAVCWSYGRTLGNVAIFSDEVMETLCGDFGEDATIACDLVEAGKMRNGARRWWCRTHQVHWGTKADIATAHTTGAVICSNHAQPMSFQVNPQIIRPESHAEVGVWCSMPPALTSAGNTIRRRPKIHVHVRDEVDGRKVIDGDFNALAVQFGETGDLFAATAPTTVYITPPAALEFIIALEDGRAMGHVACKDCGAGHLDLGEFGRTAHRKHLCGNCGRDTVWSPEPIASTPLKPLHDRFSPEPNFLDVDRILNLDEYPAASYAAWASTPAILWTSRRPQERGIHVQLSIDGKRVLDDTFGTVIHRGERLVREKLLATMLGNTIL
jgi:hypothetical protein